MRFIRSNSAQKEPVREELRNLSTRKEGSYPHCSDTLVPGTNVVLLLLNWRPSVRLAARSVVSCLTRVPGYPGYRAAGNPPLEPSIFQVQGRVSGGLAETKNLDRPVFAVFTKF
eukprot:1564391-Rhodomonas_salina.1